MTTNVQIIMTSRAALPHSTFVHKGQGAKGQPTVMKAMPGARYEIKDLAPAEQPVPPKIKLQRVGKDLNVWFDGESHADLIIEDYFTEPKSEGPNSLYGHTESGQLHEYVLPEQMLPQKIYSISESVSVQDLGIGATASDNASGAGIWGLNYLQLFSGATGGLAAVKGQISKASSVSKDLVVQGQVNAGPVHSGVTVYAFDDQGQLLGAADVDGNGAWRIVVAGRPITPGRFLSVPRTTTRRLSTSWTR